MDKSIFNEKPVSYISAYGGIEIYCAVFDIVDKIYYTVGAWTGKPSKHCTRLYYTNKGVYFVVNGTRQYLYNAIRI